eukprot:TRINITY_DN9739_c0_g1_i2.p2 TRINITY_DN9739_c0_g1~~TRINITY_DN9739_c0_g1_i2.p2  ORF type:complete len:136 (+),score=19.92 TRINITY_DN9739_c0_g1_i2:96-503(+)
MTIGARWTKDPVFLRCEYFSDRSDSVDWRPTPIEQHVLTCPLHSVECKVRRLGDQGYGDAAIGIQLVRGDEVVACHDWGPVRKWEFHPSPRTQFGGDVAVVDCARIGDTVRIVHRTGGHYVTADDVEVKLLFAPM